MCHFCGGQLYKNAHGDIVCGGCNETLDRGELETSFQEREAPPDTGMDAPYTEEGRHPHHKHLIWVECAPHHGMYIFTTPAAEGSVLANLEDVQVMLGGQYNEDDAYQAGYASDEYLELGGFKT